MDRETLDVDVLIVGAGPAGLSAAIRIAQLSQGENAARHICVVEKASEVGAHILSGAVLAPRSLNELIPDWQSKGAPLNTPVTEDQFALLTKQHKIPLPTPPQMRNHGNYIISLANLCRWLGEQAEALGVDIYPGFAATEILYGEQGEVQGVITGDMGRDKKGLHKPSYQAGMALRAKQTLFAEGCRGSLSEELMQKFKLRENCSPQSYGIGIKELWQVSPEQHKAGSVLHTVGWPLDHRTYGGSFIYHLENNQVAVGFVIGLDYKNPYLSPFDEFQRFKTHPKIRPLFEGGERVAYGARALNEGGLQSIPQLSFPGGMIIGDAAGFLNVAKIKGTHTAIKSGMLAAQATVASLKDQTIEAKSYQASIQNSWVWQELKEVRNIRPGFRYGLLPGLAYAAFDTYLLRGNAPWTFKHHPDHKSLNFAKDCQPITYPKPDGKITFDKLSSVYLSNTAHEEDQPVHLQLKDQNIPISHNLTHYDAPEQRYCPAGVYEILQQEGKPYLQINAQNCVHCKTCDIKDPLQNIHWVPPEGGGGPNYPNM